MMYNEKLVVVVKVNGKVLREQQGKVYIPFGSEYSIMVKNLHTTKAQVDISIDGEDVLGNSSILIGAGDTSELEGFLKGRDVTNRFKFIEKTSQISDYRGDNIDDGIITVNYRFERERPVARPISTLGFCDTDLYGKTLRGNSRGINNFHDTSQVYSSCNANATYSCNVNNEDGITVHGSQSDQTFQNGYIGILESKLHSLCIHLRGCDEKNIFVQKPITVKTKVLCETCGSTHKFGNKFCSNCGTSLI